MRPCEQLLFTVPIIIPIIGIVNPYLKIFIGIFEGGLIMLFSERLEELLKERKITWKEVYTTLHIGKNQKKY